MNRIFVFIIGICIYSLPAFSQKKTYRTQHYSNGNLKYEGYFVNNEPVGELKRYYEDGKIKSIQDFKNNHSSVIVFSNSGDTVSKGSYINKIKHGAWCYYSSKGTVAMKENYVMGILDGKSYVFDSAGDTVESISWKNGKMNGERKQFFPQNQPFAIMFYTDNQLSDAFTSYNDNGSIEVEGFYKNGKKEGRWKFYNASGKLIQQIEYIENEATNQEELDKQLQDAMNKHEQLKGKIKDPDNYSSDPAFYFQ